MSLTMEPPHEGRDEMHNGAELRSRRRGPKPPRAEVLSELPVVAALLVMAVVVAVMAAGGPVLDMLSSLGEAGTP
ncbi:MAG: hypothetical protein AAGJ94_03360 [Pseudomonadota bacterium]